MEEIPETEPIAETEPVAEPAEPVAEEPAQPKRGKGRPPESRNKIKVVVEPIAEPIPEPAPPEPEPLEPPTPEPRRVKAPKAKAARVMPEVAMNDATPHQTFLTAMQAWKTMAEMDRVARSNHYHKLVNDMFQ